MWFSLFSSDVDFSEKEDEEDTAAVIERRRKEREALLEVSQKLTSKVQLFLSFKELSLTNIFIIKYFL